MLSTTTTDVERRAQDALLECPIYDLQQVRVEREGNTLLLLGHVSTFYHKQLAQEVVRSITSGLRLVNLVEVD